MEGLVRFIGVTGHGAQIAATTAASLGRFASIPFAPYNFVTMPGCLLRRKLEALARTCAERKVAVADHQNPSRCDPGSAGAHPTPGTNRRDQADIDLAVWWVLGHLNLPQHSRDLDVLAARPRRRERSTKAGRRRDVFDAGACKGGTAVRLGDADIVAAGHT